MSDDGVVRGRSAGTVRIIAVVDEDTASAGVTVRLPAVTLEVTRLRDTVGVGAQYRVFVTARDSTGAIVADAPLTWSTSDSTILATDQLGWIHGRSFGNASLTVRTESAVAVLPVQVAFHRIEPSRRWAEVSVGANYSCALTTDGEAMCWGSDWAAKLGTVAPATGSPQPVLGDHRFMSISTGRVHTCGIDTDSTAWCWGANLSGQLGTGVAGPDLGSPQRVASDHRWTSIDAEGHGQTCAIASDEVPYCWGHNDNYQLGWGPGADRPEIAPYGDGGPARMIATSDFLTCMLTLTAEAYCSGTGALGNGTLGAVAGPLPVAVAGGHRFRSISTNRTLACAVTVDGQAYCWGASSDGALGTGASSAQHAAPERVAGEHVFASITTGQYHTCALTSGGVAYCWGRNTDGRLGSHLADSHAVPVRVGGPYVWRSLSAGGLYTCGVTVDDEMYCWGQGYNR